MANEEEYIPWAAALSGMSYIRTMLERTEAYGAYKKYMKGLIQPLYNRVGYEGHESDQPLNVFLRKLAVSWSCLLGIEECIRNTKTDFRTWMDQVDQDSEDANKQ